MAIIFSPINFESIFRSGDYFAYMISKSGSDWNTIKIKPTRDGTELNVILPKIATILDIDHVT
jgi:hypothetical protein